MRRRDVLIAAVAAALGRVAGARGEEAGSSVRMEQVIEALRLAGERNLEVNPGASANQLTDAERVLGLPLPPEMHELYAAFDGGWFLGGNLNLYQLFPTAEMPIGVTTASDLMREWGGPIPPELVVFASDGADGTYGLWLPDPPMGRPLVIEIAEDDAPDSFAIVGDDLAGFIAGRAAYYLLSFTADGYALEPALDALGVPADLRADFSASDEDYDRLLNWANPNLPDKTPDPYGGLTREKIAEIARSRSV